MDARRIRTEAEAFLRQGKPEFALLYLERLHEIMPACHSAYLLMADAALAAGRPDLALRSLARYLAADPLAYDRAEVRGRMAELLAGTP